jgi:hypothetical protein
MRHKTIIAYVRIILNVYVLLDSIRNALCFFQPVFHSALLNRLCNQYVVLPIEYDLLYKLLNLNQTIVSPIASSGLHADAAVQVLL